ncbi:MAG: FAD-dependent oxidoreductase [bacterium]|nr:FAD-dependent oxidoreductase [bacterium]
MKDKKISRKKFLAVSAVSAAAVGTGLVLGLDDNKPTPEKARAIEPPKPEKSTKRIRENSRSIPVLAETDVLVVGSGPSGLAAALSAAKEGVNTILLERYGFFGGVITQVNMGSIAWYRYADTVDAGGICTEFETKAKEMGASIDTFEMMRKIPFVTGILEKEGLLVDGKATHELLDTEMFKHVADTMLLESGTIPVLHCLAVGAIMNGSTIEGVITESKSGRQAILAKRVIDATGDADVAHFAGADYRKDPKDKLHGVTTNFSCSGVSVLPFMSSNMLSTSKMKDFNLKTSGKEDEMSASAILKDPFEKAKKAGLLEKDWTIVGLWDGLTGEGEILSMDAVHMDNIDPTDIIDLTRAEMEGRRQAVLAMEALNKYQTGFSDARIRNFHTQLGIRESRKIIGTYNITEHDIKNQAKFKDSIGICPEFLDGYYILYLPTTGRYFQVPYGIMLPEKVENLLVAGRAVAGDKISHTATRQMVCCMVTGQGAGVAAAVSIKDKVSCRRVNISTVQERLKKQGVRIS